ncbi:MAG: hypothetical protein QM541_02445 [Flavobacterium sp.]|nr:hypothetical protein [Flavobacterium sp.]
MATIKKVASKKAVPKKAPKKAALKTAVVGTKKKTTKKQVNDGCYFTTACTEFYGLPDDCYQLQTLRQFRDTYMSKNQKDIALVKLYYRVAPTIVKKIKLTANSFNEFEIIFKHVNEACSLIELNKITQAKELYSEMVNGLIKKYLKV